MLRRPAVHPSVIDAGVDLEIVSLGCQAGAAASRDHRQQLLAAAGPRSLRRCVDHSNGVVFAKKYRNVLAWCNARKAKHQGILHAVSYEFLIFSGEDDERLRQLTSHLIMLAQHLIRTMAGSSSSDWFPLYYSAGLYQS